MANVTITFGAGNDAERNARHTDDLRRDGTLYQYLGASRENTEFLRDGAPYSGPLNDGDRLTLVTRANSKA